MKFNNVKLSEIASVQTGPFGSQLHKSDYVDEGTPIITVEHLGDNRIVYNNMPKITDYDKERLSKYHLQEEDIVFSRVGSVDRRALVQKKEEGWLFSGRCLRVRVTDKSRADPRYLSYFFGTNRFKEMIRSIAVGATMPSLNTKIMNNLEIELPNITTQVKISLLLDSITNKIQLNTQIISNLKELAQTLFKRWFVDFEFPNENGDPYRSNDGKIVESELGLIPTSFKIMKLDEISQIIGGGTPSKKRADYYTEKGIPWITPKDLSNNKNIFIERGALDISDLGLKESSARLLPEKTILFSSRAPIGYIAISMHEVSTNQGFKSLIPNEKVSYIYIFFLMKYLLPMIEASASGSTFKEISGKGLKNIKAVIPDITLINKFEKIIEPFFDEIKEKEKEIEHLTNLRDLLLPKLLSGELELYNGNEVKDDVPIS